MYPRIIKSQIEQDLRELNKIIILYGPGKLAKLRSLKNSLKGILMHCLSMPIS